MAGIKISALPAVASALTTDFFPVVQGGVTSRETLAQVQTLFGYSGGILSVASGGTGDSTLAAHGVLVGEGTSAIVSKTLTAGQILIGTTAADPTAATITSGTGITVTSSSASITVALSGSGPGTLTWNDVAGTTQAAAVNNGYICSAAGATTVTLPATAAEGSVFAVQGKGAAGWILQMNTGQTLHYGSVASTSAGTLTSTNQWDSVSIVCVTANTTFAVTASQGTLTAA